MTEKTDESLPGNQAKADAGGSAPIVATCDYCYAIGACPKCWGRSAIEALRVPKWQPIETAPKDGTPILGRKGTNMAVVQWWEGHHLDGGGYWELMVCGAHAEDSEWTPTEWMPLPAPPSDNRKA